MNASAIFSVTFVSLPIILGSIGGVVVLIGLLVLLYFTLGVHYRMKSQVSDIYQKFEYLHALLFGQDSQYVKRIEMISRTNLIYGDILLTLGRRFKDIRDNSDSAMQTEVNHIRDLLGDRNYKTLKLELPKVKEELADYEEKVNTLNEDLKQVFAPEEECRAFSLSLKDKLRQTKQDYYVKQTDLSLVASSFEAAFKRLDEVFGRFESLVESGHYEEAKEELKDAPAVINELSRDLIVLPNLCLTIQSVIPDKINSLKERFEMMIEEGYPLHMILGRERIAEMRDELDAITAQVQQFKLSNVQESLDGMIAEIEEYFDAFEREKEARVRFESECDTIYVEDNEVEQKNIRLWNALPEIKKVYVIPSEEQAKVDSIKTLISKASATKRSLDTFIHSGSSQPFTVLVDKMHQLRDEAAEARAAIDAFDSYLMSLKSDSEAAMRAVMEYYDALQSCEVAIRQIAVEPITEEYTPQIDDLFATIDRIYALLYSKPIDVIAVNELVGDLISRGEEVCRKINALSAEMASADASLLIANRYRRDFTNMNLIVQQAEKLYFSGDFSTCYIDTTSAIKKLTDE